MTESSFQSHVQIFVVSGIFPYIAEKFRGKNEKALGLHHILTGHLRILVREVSVVEVLVTSLNLVSVQVIG